MSTVARTSWPRLGAYASLRMPLALVELPLFVLLPSLYGDHFGVDLGVIGLALFITRFADALIDPGIGTLIDANQARWQFRHWIWMALPVLFLGFTALMFPYPRDPSVLGWWLAGASTITYLGYSVASIAYQAWGSSIGRTDSERARVTGLRESFGLFGVMLAAMLLQPESIRPLTVLIAVMIVIAAWALRHAPTTTTDAAGPALATPGGAQRGTLLRTWKTVLGSGPFRWLLAAMVVNGIATAVPATLVLFYVKDVLQAEAVAPWFLLTYFLAGAAGMPLWIVLAARIGLRHAWLIGISFAIIAFVWALALGAGDTGSFFVVCALTGLALGADLAMPPALLASVISDQGHQGRHEGAYFGVWNLATKLCLAAAAGLALPLLGMLGYQPGMTGASVLSLSLTYAALPCALKLVAAVILVLEPPPESRPRPIA